MKSLVYMRKFQIYLRTEEKFQFDSILKQYWNK